MARLTSQIQFTGSLGELSAYRMRGVDGIVVRRKGGPTKKRIKTDPAFANTRRINAEFDAKAKASSLISRALWTMKPLADYNITPALIGLMTNIQVLDTTSAYGKRDVRLSRNPEVLEGFSLNRRTLFESIVRVGLEFTIDKKEGTARVSIPALVPGINFKPQQEHAMYSVCASLGVVPDIVLTKNGYKPKGNKAVSHPNTATTPWHSTKRKAKASTLELKLHSLPSDPTATLVLSVGIMFGTPVGDDVIEQKKHAGAAKILKLA